MELGSKLGVILVRWPRWSLETLRGRKDSVILELAELDRSAQQKHARPRSTSKTINVEAFLTCTSCLLLAGRQWNETVVDSFVSVAITVSAALLVVRFLIGVTEPVLWSLESPERGWRAVLWDLFVLSCFLVSTIPFTLPWLLAFFFPYEFLLVAVVFTLCNMLIRLMSWPKNNQQPKSENLSPWRANRKAHSTFLKWSGLKSEKVLREYVSSEFGRGWCGAFILLEFMLVLVSCVLSYIWEKLLFSYLPALGGMEGDGVVWGTASIPRTWPILFSTLFLGVLSTSMFLQAFWLQYAAGGRWLHFENGWSFFQPFKGGATFVILQIGAWSMYGLCLSLSAARLEPVILTALSSFEHIYPVAAFTLKHMGIIARFTGLDRCRPGGVALLYIVADILLVLSLPHFESENSQKVNPRSGIASREWQGLKQNGAKGQEPQKFVANSVVEEVDSFWTALDDVGRTVCLSFILFSSVKPEILLTSISLVVATYVEDPTTALCIFFTVIAIYLPTYGGKPSLTGSRSKVQRLSNGAHSWETQMHSVYRMISKHFRLTAVRDTTCFWDSSSEYVFGYHPHGLIPSGATYLKNTEQWASLFPGIYPATLSASITHVIPILRDLNQWTGSLEVTKRGLWSGLDRFGSVMLVPGGQHEMLLEATAKFEPISAKHRGFVRIALMRAARNAVSPVHLVPTFAFGERKTVRNMPMPISVQKWFVDQLRTNVAFFPVGRFGLPSVPDRGPVTIVVGEPIRVPVITAKSKCPTEAQVALLHRFYYSRLKTLFDRYKAAHGDGYEDMEMIFEPPVESILEEDFEREWSSLAQDGKPFDEKEEELFLSQVDHVKRVDFPWQEFTIAFSMVAFFLFGPYFALRM